MGLGSGLLDFIGGAAETAGAIASNRMTSQLEQEADEKKAKFAAKIQGKLQEDKAAADALAAKIKARGDSARTLSTNAARVAAAKIAAKATENAAATRATTDLSVQGLRNSGALSRQSAADDEANYRAAIDAATRKAVADKQARARKYDADHRGNGSRKSDDSGGPVSSLINFISGGGSGGLPIR